ARPSAWNPADARDAASARPRGLVPRLLARDLGGRAPGARRVHLRRRPEPGAAAAVPGALAERNRDDPPAPRRSMGRLPLAADGAGAVRAPEPDCETGGARRAGLLVAQRRGRV